MNLDPVPEKIRVLERPDPGLWLYYIICSVFTGPGILVTLPYLFFRYHNLRYRFDEQGIHMKVGILFRREVNLTYARIQDIHLRSNVVQRWLGLAVLQVQTASSSSGPELVIEGLKEFEMLRDFLYTRMRGYQTAGKVAARPRKAEEYASEPAPGTSAGSEAGNFQLMEVLVGIRDELRKTREALEERKGNTQ